MLPQPRARSRRTNLLLSIALVGAAMAAVPVRSQADEVGKTIAQVDAVAAEETTSSAEDVYVPGQHDEIVVTGTKKQPPPPLPAIVLPVIDPVPPEIIVVARLKKPRHVAIRDFQPVMKAVSVRREARTVGVISLVLSGVDGIISARCIAMGACMEINPIFGHFPSPAKMLGLKTAVGGTTLHKIRKDADIDPFHARDAAYGSLVPNLLVAMSSAVVGL